MSFGRWALGIAGVLLALAAAWQIQAAAQGLVEVRASAGDTPAAFIGPAGAMDGSRPLVLVGHGLAGSDRIMRGFAYTFARAGYVAAVVAEGPAGVHLRGQDLPREAHGHGDVARLVGDATVIVFDNLTHTATIAASDPADVPELIQAKFWLAAGTAATADPVS